MVTKLGPLDEKLARVLADRRGLSVDALISRLLRDDAAFELLETTADRTRNRPDCPKECAELAAAAH